MCLLAEYKSVKQTRLSENYINLLEMSIVKHGNVNTEQTAFDLSDIQTVEASKYFESSHMFWSKQTNKKKKHISTNSNINKGCNDNNNNNLKKTQKLISQHILRLISQSSNR